MPSIHALKIHRASILVLSITTPQGEGRGDIKALKNTTDYDYLFLRDPSHKTIIVFHNHTTGGAGGHRIILRSTNSSYPCTEDRSHTNVGSFQNHTTGGAGDHHDHWGGRRARPWTLVHIYVYIWVQIYVFMYICICVYVMTVRFAIGIGTRNKRETAMYW